jgi:hypothetical protein
MPAQPKEYRRLPGRGVRREGILSSAFTAKRSRLWLGRDHLLLVETQWFTEEYRRFPFRDLQAVIIRQTTRGKITNLVLGLLVLLFGLLGTLFATGGWLVFWLILAGVLLLFLLLNALLGPTGFCHLRTAVQMEEMPSLRRVNRARKVMARVRPLIAEAQGQLAAAEAPPLVAPAAGTPEAAAPASTEPPTPTPPPA